jgi:Fe-S-cluster containining protein
MEKWAEQFNLPLPQCKKCGTCCLCVSPSKSWKILLEKAAKGEVFARDFFTIFIPYKNHDQAKKISKTIVERVQKSSATGKSQVPLEDLVFYRCRHYHAVKKCTIYPDRPKLCRDFPGSPFVILHENCAFYEWAMQCREKYNQLEKDLEKLKDFKKELDSLKYQQKCVFLLEKVKKYDNPEYKFMLLNPELSLISPGASWIKIFYKV